MKLPFIYNLLAIAIAALITAAVAPYTPLQSVATVAILKANNFQGLPQVTLRGYYSNTDGGEGTLTYTSTPCTEDGGYCFHDGAGNSFVRVHLTGDLRQYGVTQGSAYDMAAHPTTATDATPVIANAFTALQSIGLNSVNTRQVSIILRTTLTIPINGDLGCDIQTGGPFNDGNYTNHPGTIYTAHNHYIYSSDSSESVHNCLGLPEWYTNPSAATACGGFSFNYPPLVESDLEYYRGNMIACHDQWLFSDNARGGKYHHLWVYGFDNPIHFNKPNEVDLSFAWMDGDISFYSTNGGSATNVTVGRSEPYITRQVSVGWNTAPAATIIPNQEDFSIRTISAGAANGWGTHECRLTLQADTNNYPVTDILQSNIDANGTPITFPLFVTNLQNAGAASGPGAIACLGNGPWATHNLSYNSGTHTLTLDLLNSQYGHGADAVVLTGNWNTGENTTGCLCATIRVASGDMRSAYPGMTVTGTGIGAGSTVIKVVRSALGPDPYSAYLGEIVIGFTAGNAPTTQANDTTITLDGGAYAPPGPATDCTSQNDDTYGCVYLNAAARVYAGQSDAGIDSATLPMSNQIPYAASWLWHDTVGMRFENIQNFDHHYNIVAYSSNGCNIVAQGGDDNGEIDDTSVVGYYTLNKTNHCNIYGGSLGKSGTGVIMDTWSNSDHDTHTVTLSGSLGTGGAGTTITTAAGLSAFNKDTWGHFALHICQSLSSDGDCSKGGDPSNTSEVIFCKYVNDTSCTIVSRAEYSTSIQSFTNGAHIFQYDTGSGSNWTHFFGVGEGNTAPDLDSFQVTHGDLGLFGNVERGGNRTGYISANANLVKFSLVAMYNLTIIYENAAALGITSGCGNTFLVTQVWECYSAQPVSPVTSTILIDGSSRAIQCDASGGPVALSVNAGSKLVNFDFSVMKIDSSTNLCTITMHSGDTIGGATGTALAVINDALRAKNVNGTTSWILIP